MPDDTHDMRLLAVCVDGVAQRLAVDGQRLVVPAVLLVPALRARSSCAGSTRIRRVRMVDRHGGLRTPLRRDTEPFEGFMAKGDPFPNRLVATGAAQRRGARECDAGQGMARPLRVRGSSMSMK